MDIPLEGIAAAALLVTVAGLAAEPGYERVLDGIRDAFLRIHPAPEYRGIQGPDWFEAYRPRLRAARDPAAATAVLEEVVAGFRDTHTRLVRTPVDACRALPPVALGEVEGRIVVLRAPPGASLEPGEEIVRADGVPIWTLVRTARRRTPGSTPAARTLGACARALAGPLGSEVRLLARLDARSSREVTLRRGASLPPEAAVWTRDLRGGAGLVRIARFGGDPHFLEVFDEALARFRDRPGIAIDVRGNGAGSDRLAEAVAGRFVERTLLARIDLWREPGTDRFRKIPRRVRPRGPWTWGGRVAVLIDAGSAGACEHFVAAMEARGGALLVGEATGGAGGGPTTVELPEGYAIRIPRAIRLRPSGVLFEGHGIPPHVARPPTVRALRQGRDEALEAAVDWILSGRPVPRHRAQPLAPPPAPRRAVRLAVCQIRCVDGDVEGNLGRIAEAVEEAARREARIACFPEAALIGWVNPGAHTLARPVPGPHTDAIAAMARRHRIHVAIGITERADGGIYDTAILVGPDGRILAKHRKIHTLRELLDPPYLRGRKEEIAAVETPLGRIGLLVCADTFREELLAAMRAQRPDLVLVPYGWAAPPEAWPGHGASLEGTVGRAARTIRAPLIGPNAIGRITGGPWRGRTYEGHSVAADDRGRVIFIGRPGEREVAVLEIDLPAG